jgi:hypothetical protein
MSLQPKSDLLTVLRQNLRRIEENAVGDLSREVIELKNLLQLRIANIEAALSCLKPLIGSR